MPGGRPHLRPRPPGRDLRQRETEGRAWTTRTTRTARCKAKSATSIQMGMITTNWGLSTASRRHDHGWPDGTKRAGERKMPPALTDTDTDEPVQLGTAQWGKLIRSTNNGRTELYELDLGAWPQGVNARYLGGPGRRTRATARAAVIDIGIDRSLGPIARKQSSGARHKPRPACVFMRSLIL